ncbi:MAG: PEP-CTERM sorting domain-containing protein [Candidatus Thiodiazotropha sp.]
MIKRLSFYNLVGTLAFCGAMTLSLPLNAGALGFWAADGWSVLDAEDGVSAGGYVGPGFGGQEFDAEYLFYKVEENLLSVGLQTGFDLSDGSHHDEDFDYAIDFGLVTKDRWYHDVGVGTGNQDAAGLYEVSQWNNNIIYSSSSPYGMDEGTLLAALVDSSEGEALLADGLSYYRTATIDLAALGFDVKSFTAHWTMSCGNDVVEGSADVPEPNALLLMAIGLLGLLGGRRLRA